VAKVKSNRGRSGYVFFKELGGAPQRKTLSKTARVLSSGGLLRGRILDYGCGFGFDADQLGWEAYDPYYRPTQPTGLYDTIIVNHVANILTRATRAELFATVNALLAPGGTAYISVARNIPVTGKPGPRRRIQNYVVLTLPSVFADDEEEIYRLAKDAVFADRTREFEQTV
jgi:SAM-dependent methyltransferase